LFALAILPFCTYAGPNYWGGTGLLRIPTARLIADGDLRFTVSDSYPYRNYAVTFGFLPFLELNGRIIEMRDEKATGPVWGGYGYHKDKAADFKMLLFKESSLFPAVVFGVNDFHGADKHQHFFNEYIVLSKQVGNFDITIGYGANMFGSLFREKSTDMRELDGLFAGTEWKVQDNLSLLLEYDPAKKLAMGRGDISSNYNYGIRWQPWQWLSCGYSYQRGEEHSFIISITYPFGKTLAPKKPDYPFYGPLDWTPLRGTLSRRPLSERLLTIHDYLEEEGFKDAQVSISADMRTLYISFENRQYLSHNKAAGRVLRIAAAQSPSDVENICLTLKQQGIPMVEITVFKADYIDYLNENISGEEMKVKTKISSEISGKFYWRYSGDGKIPKQRSSFSYKFEPVILETFLNDPSGFFKFRVGPAVSLKQQLAKGLSVESHIKFPLYSNVETNQDPISDSPVRSDVTDYLGSTGPAVETLFVNRFLRLGTNNYLKLTGGYMEMQYAGITAEYLRTFKQGRFALGHEITWSKKRAPGSVFGLHEQSGTVTGLFNAYLYAPELDTVFSANAGKFLAGDRGVKLQVTRDIRGGKIFLWYTKTDTSGLTGENRGYSDKGVGFAIPVRVFSDSDVHGHYPLVFTPWSRDTGQSVKQPYSLYDFMREFTPSYILNNWKEFKE